MFKSHGYFNRVFIYSLSQDIMERKTAQAMQFAARQCKSEVIHLVGRWTAG